MDEALECLENVLIARVLRARGEVNKSLRPQLGVALAKLLTRLVETIIVILLHMMLTDLMTHC